MKRRITTQRRAQARTQAKLQADYVCRDCAHMYDPHSRALDGHLILGRCPFDAATENGKWCLFLSQPACENFKLRQRQNGKEEK